MRDKTIVQAQDEIKILDKISDGLSDTLRAGYDQLRTNSPAVRRSGGDIEVEARLHNIRLSALDALEEVARRGYGRVALLEEVNDAGNVVGHRICRVSQANASLPEAAIVPRNSPMGSEIASCQVGDELEIKLPPGERYFVVTALIDLEGAVQLMRPRPEIKLARFRVADDPEEDVIREVRTFLENLIPGKAPTIPPLPAAAEVKPTAFDFFWPPDWSKVLLAHEPEAALSTKFFTQTTRQQENAIRAVRGVTVVNGIAGTGKTSIALGRLKFFANFRSGEHLREYGLDPNDWVDFDSSNMIGFVLSANLVQYLKQTAEDLEMRIKIMDFEEYRNEQRQSRRLFGRPFKRSPDRNGDIQQTIRWLRACADIASIQLANAIEAIQQEPLTKPQTPDGSRISETRWRELDARLWKSGPLKARIVGLVRRLKSRGDDSTALRLQGIANSMDNDIRLSDSETAALTAGERRAIREAVLNLALRFLRLLNPTELYVNVFNGESINEVLPAHFEEQLEVAHEAARLTSLRLEERLTTDDDVVTALCLNALICDQFERDIRDIPYLVTFSDRVGVFIDEYQDFSEQQVFLMGLRAKRKYRQITVAGDGGQRLHDSGVTQIANSFPYITEPVRQISLDRNFRQSKWLAQLSNSFRSFTEGGGPGAEEPCGAPLHSYEDELEYAEFVASKISGLPDAASVVVISPTRETAQSWFDRIGPSLESAFRNPIVSDRARLTERLKTHFTTSLDAKGLEFDVAVIPDISEFSDADPIALNGLYVAVSRPRHAILLGCRRSKAEHNVVKQLRHRGDLVQVSLSQ